MDLHLRQLMDKYYVNPEFSMMGMERKAATLELTNEVAIIAESQRKAELYLEEQLEAHTHQVVMS